MEYRIIKELERAVRRPLVERKHVREFVTPDGISGFIERTAGFAVKNGKITELSLYGCGLEEIPPVLKKFENLEILDLGRNFIISAENLPVNSRGLRELYLDNNRIVNLTAELFVFRNLEILNLGNNYIGNIPDAIENLVNLRRLYLYGNRLKALPRTVTNLPNLEILNIYDNLIEMLPEGLGSTSPLKILRASSNLIKNIPRSLSISPTVREIHLRQNKITFIPVEILESRNLEMLDLWKNKIEVLPNGYDREKLPDFVRLNGNPVMESAGNDITGTSFRNKRPVLTGSDFKRRFRAGSFGIQSGLIGLGDPEFFKADESEIFYIEIGAPNGKWAVFPHPEPFYGEYCRITLISEDYISRNLYKENMEEVSVRIISGRIAIGDVGLFKKCISDNSDLCTEAKRREWMLDNDDHGVGHVSLVFYGEGLFISPEHPKNMVGFILTVRIYHNYRKKAAAFDLYIPVGIDMA